MATLLEKANQARWKGSDKAQITPEDHELARAWALKQVETYQVGAAKGMAKGSNLHPQVYRYLADVFADIIVKNSNKH
jgi:hypothetical protein